MSKFVENQEVTIINEHGAHEVGFKIFNPRIDKEGYISLEKNGTVTRVNPKRIVTGDTAMATASGTPVLTEKKVIVTRPKTTPMKVDLSEIAKRGELWVKGNVDFDGKTDVKTLCLLFSTKNRYLSFNIYNGTYGKKQKLPPIDQVLSGEEVGYKFDDIQKQRDKLIKGGYVKFGTPSETPVVTTPVVTAPVAQPQAVTAEKITAGV